MNEHIACGPEHHQTEDVDCMECLACQTLVADADPMPAQLRRQERQHYLRGELEARRGNRNGSSARFSRGLVMEQSVERYFRVLAQARASLAGRFDAEDFRILLNMNPTPMWQHSAGEGELAGRVIDAYVDHDVESLEDISDPKLRGLILRLSGLSPLEQLALVDVCERVFRGYDNPLLQSRAGGAQ